MQAQPAVNTRKNTITAPKTTMLTSLNATAHGNWNATSIPMMRKAPRSRSVSNAASSPSQCSSTGAGAVYGETRDGRQSGSAGQVGIALKWTAFYARISLRSGGPRTRNQIKSKLQQIFELLNEKPPDQSDKFALQARLRNNAGLTRALSP